MKPVFLCCTLILITCSCHKSEHTASHPASELFPDHIGDRWTYQVIDTSYTQVSSYSISQYTMNVYVAGDATLPGGTPAHLWVFQSPNRNDSSYVFWNADTVSFASIRNNYVFIDRRYVVPGLVGLSWDYTGNSINDVTIISRGMVNTGQNTFIDAFDISGYPGMPDNIVSINEWMENNVGLVSKYLDASGTLNPFKHRTLWSLVSYQLH